MCATCLEHAVAMFRLVVSESGFAKVLPSEEQQAGRLSQHGCLADVQQRPKICLV